MTTDGCCRPGCTSSDTGLLTDGLWYASDSILIGGAGICGKIVCGVGSVGVRGTIGAVGGRGGNCGASCTFVSTSAFAAPPLAAGVSGCMACFGVNGCVTFISGCPSTDCPSNSAASPVPDTPNNVN